MDNLKQKQLCSTGEVGRKTNFVLDVLKSDEGEYTVCVNQMVDTQKLSADQTICVLKSKIDQLLILLGSVGWTYSGRGQLQDSKIDMSRAAIGEPIWTSSKDSVAGVNHGKLQVNEQLCGMKRYNLLVNGTMGRVNCSAEEILGILSAYDLVYAKEFIDVVLSRK